MTDFRMPSLGADMEDGTLVEWLVRPGEAVKRGDIVAIVETQKGAIEIEIFRAGVIADLVVPVGQKVPVGAVLAHLDGGEATAAVRSLTVGPMEQAVPIVVPPTPEATAQPATTRAFAPPIAASVEAAAPIAAASPIVATEPVPAIAAPFPVTVAASASSFAQSLPEARARISPAARRAAAQRGIDLGPLKGTGVGGAITLGDLAAAPSQPVAPTSAQPPLTRRVGFEPAAMRQAIAAAMSRSNREIPHYYLTQTVEVGAALARLERMNRDRAPPDRLLPAVLFLRATALALTKCPELNGYWEDGRFRPGDAIHIGWAIALRGGGLVAPAIREADRRSLDELMAAMRDLVLRARSGRLRGSEFTDPTITVTSLGDRGAESVLPIIQPPQVAMVGIGRVVTRPWAVGDAVGLRPVVAATLAGDHRASDGHRGGLLLAEIERLLQNPEAL